MVIILWDFLDPAAAPAPAQESRIKRHNETKQCGIAEMREEEMRESKSKNK